MLRPLDIPILLNIVVHNTKKEERKNTVVLTLRAKMIGKNAGTAFGFYLSYYQGKLILSITVLRKCSM